MKKIYNQPKITRFGNLSSLTRYGVGGGSSDIVYLANPPGVDAVLFFQAAGLSLADAQVVVAIQLSLAPGGDSFGAALANISIPAGTGGSFSPTLGATFTP